MLWRGLTWRLTHLSKWPSQSWIPCSMALGGRSISGSREKYCSVANLFAPWVCETPRYNRLSARFIWCHRIGPPLVVSKVRIIIRPAAHRHRSVGLVVRCGGAQLDSCHSPWLGVGGEFMVLSSFSFSLTRSVVLKNWPARCRWWV